MQEDSDEERLAKSSSKLGKDVKRLSKSLKESKGRFEELDENDESPVDLRSAEQIRRDRDKEKEADGKGKSKDQDTLNKEKSKGKGDESSQSQSNPITSSTPTSSTTTKGRIYASSDSNASSDEDGTGRRSNRSQKRQFDKQRMKEEKRLEEEEIRRSNVRERGEYRSKVKLKSGKLRRDSDTESEGNSLEVDVGKEKEKVRLGEKEKEKLKVHFGGSEPKEESFGVKEKFRPLETPIPKPKSASKSIFENKNSPFKGIFSTDKKTAGSKNENVKRPLGNLYPTPTPNPSPVKEKNKAGGIFEGGNSSFKGIFSNQTDGQKSELDFDDSPTSPLIKQQNGTGTQSSSMKKGFLLSKNSLQEVKEKGKDITEESFDAEKVADNSNDREWFKTFADKFLQEKKDSGSGSDTKNSDGAGKLEDVLSETERDLKGRPRGRSLSRNSVGQVGEGLPSFTDSDIPGLSFLLAQAGKTVLEKDLQPKSKSTPEEDDGKAARVEDLKRWHSNFKLSQDSLEEVGEKDGKSSIKIGEEKKKELVGDQSELEVEALLSSEAQDSEGNDHSTRTLDDSSSFYQNQSVDVSSASRQEELRTSIKSVGTLSTSQNQTGIDAAQDDSVSRIESYSSAQEELNRSVLSLLSHDDSPRSCKVTQVDETSILPSGRPERGSMLPAKEEADDSRQESSKSTEQLEESHIGGGDQIVKDQTQVQSEQITPDKITVRRLNVGKGADRSLSAISDLALESGSGTAFNFKSDLPLVVDSTDEKKDVKFNFGTSSQEAFERSLTEKEQQDEAQLQGDSFSSTSSSQADRPIAALPRSSPSKKHPASSSSFQIPPSPNMENQILMEKIAKDHQMKSRNDNNESNFAEGSSQSQGEEVSSLDRERLLDLAKSYARMTSSDKWDNEEAEEGSDDDQVSGTESDSELVSSTNAVENSGASSARAIALESNLIDRTIRIHNQTRGGISEESEVETLDGEGNELRTESFFDPTKKEPRHYDFGDIASHSQQQDFSHARSSSAEDEDEDGEEDSGEGSGGGLEQDDEDYEASVDSDDSRSTDSEDGDQEEEDVFNEDTIFRKDSRVNQASGTGMKREQSGFSMTNTTPGNSPQQKRTPLEMPTSNQDLFSRMAGNHPRTVVASDSEEDSDMPLKNVASQSKGSWPAYEGLFRDKTAEASETEEEVIDSQYLQSGSASPHQETGPYQSLDPFPASTQQTALMKAKSRTIEYSDDSDAELQNQKSPYDETETETKKVPLSASLQAIKDRLASNGVTTSSTLYENLKERREKKKMGRNQDDEDRIPRKEYQIHLRESLRNGGKLETLERGRNKPRVQSLDELRRLDLIVESSRPDVEVRLAYRERNEEIESRLEEESKEKRKGINREMQRLRELEERKEGKRMSKDGSRLDFDAPVSKDRYGGDSHRNL